MKRILVMVAAAALIFMAGTVSFFWAGLAGQKAPARDTKTAPPGETVVNPDRDRDSSPAKTEGLLRLKEPLNILVVGIDRYGSPDGQPRPGPCRADVLVVARLDPLQGSVTCLSVPRDTGAVIPGHGREKIAHAYAYGEMPLTVQAVEELLDIPLDEYISIDYRAFSRIVDVLGGVEVVVEKEMKSEYYHFQPGQQVLNGEQAYYYIIDRNDPMADIARINRQHYFLMALWQRAREQMNILDLAGIYQELRRESETSLTLLEVMRLATFVREANPEHMTMYTLPGKPGTESGTSYWIPDQPGWQEIKNSWTGAENRDH